jgi:hypothetical protein
MPVQLLVVLAMLFALAGCYPDKKCSGDGLVFDDENALCVCPTGSMFKDGACRCMMAGAELIDGKCVVEDSGVPPMADAGQSDAAAYEGASCTDYCSFMTMCLGTNGLATSVLPDVVMGLHANDAAACTTSCKDDLGSNEASDPALGCMVAAAPSSMCMDPNPQMGLANTLGVVGQCCATNASSPLCMSICETLKASPVTGSMVPFCG